MKILGQSLLSGGSSQIAFTSDGRCVGAGVGGAGGGGQGWWGTAGWRVAALADGLAGVEVPGLLLSLTHLNPHVTHTHPFPPSPRPPLLPFFLVTGIPGMTICGCGTNPKCEKMARSLFLPFFLVTGIPGMTICGCGTNPKCEKIARSHFSPEALCPSTNERIAMWSLYTQRAPCDASIKKESKMLRSGEKGCATYGRNGCVWVER